MLKTDGAVIRAFHITLVVVPLWVFWQLITPPSTTAAHPDVHRVMLSIISEDNFAFVSLAVGVQAALSYIRLHDDHFIIKPFYSCIVLMIWHSFFAATYALAAWSTNISWFLFVIFAIQSMVLAWRYRYANLRV